MTAYTVRVNAEYSTEVDAPNEDAAIAQAMAVDLKDWDQVAWSEPEAEES